MLQGIGLDLFLGHQIDHLPVQAADPQIGSPAAPHLPEDIFHAHPETVILKVQPGIELLALFRQLNAPVGAAKELAAIILFDPGNGLAQGGLADKQLLGSPGDILMLRRAEEDLDLMHIDG